MKKLSIIRFKPKPECFDEFLENVRANSRESRTANPPTPSGVAREAMVVFKLEGGKALTGEATSSFLLRFAPLWG